MKLIDADEILPMMERKMDMQDLYLPIHFQEMVIDEMPTVDAVPVVRCKDCKHYRTSDAGHPDCDYCNRLICGTVRPDFYCADGERKDDVSD
jgi:hypothetical protein